MNPYTTMSQARIQPQDLAALLRVNQIMAGPALVAFERQRRYQVEAEVDCFLKQNGAKPPASSSRVLLLRQAIGAALVPRRRTARKRPPPR